MEKAEQDFKKIQHLVENNDLDMICSAGFIVRAPFRALIVHRELMKKHGINIIYHTISNQKLYINKNKEEKGIWKKPQY